MAGRSFAGYARRGRPAGHFPAVDRRRMLTPHSHAISTCWRAERRRIGAPINTPSLGRTPSVLKTPQNRGFSRKRVLERAHVLKREMAGTFVAVSP